MRDKNWRHCEDFWIQNPYRRDKIIGEVKQTLKDAGINITFSRHIQQAVPVTAQ